MDIPSSVSWKDGVATTGGEVSNLFASFFGSIYAEKVNDIGEPMPAAQAVKTSTSYDVKLSELAIRFAEVYEQICKLDGKKGAGLDGIPNILLKSCAVGLAEPITHIFSKSLEMGIFPSAWKRSCICPIYKAGSRSEVSNYGPICIQPAMAKLFEKLVLQQVNFAFKNTISTKQHGFFGGRSTATNLYLYVDYVLRALDKGENSSHYLHGLQQSLRHGGS
ncbi:uncharacterized protein LOC126766063 [Bactrocera neohumeralis]|uniref:uncharacterized protein LOC126766063 n=1 Tax=Bactrocera neohumeralis TaxID=98809 RepID=UPI0021664DE2|nr:uncharacterized protein LOC126766063 [Bactrocera neohumeralis]